MLCFCFVLFCFVLFFVDTLFKLIPAERESEVSTGNNEAKISITSFKSWLKLGKSPFFTCLFYAYVFNKDYISSLLPMCYNLLF